MDSLKDKPEFLEIYSTTLLEYPFGVFNPVPTAVPPMGSSLR